MQKVGLFKKFNAQFVAILTILLLGFLGCFALTNKTITNDSVNAETTATNLSVSVVKHKDADQDNLTYNKNGGETGTLANGDIVKVPSITNGQFVLLDTYGEQDSESTNLFVRDALLVHFGDVSYINAIDIKFNGVSIKINSKMEVAETETTESYEWFGQYLHVLTSAQLSGNSLNSSFYTYNKSTDEIISNPEGRYDITVTYRGNTNGVDVQKTESIYFYAITEATYRQINQQPTMNDARIAADLDGYYKQFLYHFTNTDTNTAVENTDATTGATTLSYSRDVLTTDTKSDTDKVLYYPTLTFNPEKYNLTITKTLYKAVETTTMVFSTLSTNGGISETGTLVLTTKNSSGVVLRTRTLSLTPDNNGIYSTTLEFNQVGEYNIVKAFCLRTGTTTSTTGIVATYVSVSASSVISADNSDQESIDSEDITKPEKLIINGYQTNYASTSTATSIMYNDSYTTNIYQAGYIYGTNYNFVNNESADDGLHSLPSNLDTYKTFLNNQILTNTKTIMASTNQAPVSFDYLGSLRTNSGSNIYNWYVRVDNNNNATTLAYTKGKQFTEAGTYYVHLTFFNSIYSSETVSQNGDEYFTQIICFRIVNSAIKASLYTISTDITVDTNTVGNTNHLLSPKDNDSTLSITNLSVNGYTNKNVYIEWAKEGPFDCSISASYSYSSTYADSTNYTNAVQGLTYYSHLTYADDTYSTTYTRASQSGTSIFVNSGKYSVRIIKNGDTNTATYFDFIIDKDAISGIKALQVANGAVYIENNSAINLSMQASNNSSDGYNLTVNSPFAWTWNDKNSGAPIEYAKYFYASLNSISNFETPDAITDNTDLWVQTNGEFSAFSYPTDYNKIQKMNDGTYIGSTASSAQTISSPQVAVLILRDAAGNTSMFVTIYDNTKPNIIQDPSQTTYQNIITSDTTLTWGTHKVLQITANDGSPTDVSRMILGDTGIVSSNLKFSSAWKLSYGGYTYSLPTALASSATNQFDSGEKTIESGSTTQEYLKVAITKMSVTYEDQTFTFSKSAGNFINGVRIVVDIAETNNDNSYTYLQALTESGDSILTGSGTEINLDEVGECIYKFSITDKTNNVKSETITVNLDQSQGTFYSYNTVNSTLLSSIDTSQTESSQFNRRYIPQTYSTNRRYSTYSWKEPSNDSYFRVQSVVVKYYPLTNDTASSNYPYSESYTANTLYDLDNGGKSSIVNNVLYDSNGNNVDASTPYYQTNSLYTTHSIDFGGLASQEGMYEFVRLYTSDFDTLDSNITNGDVRERTYYYYVDRNEILSSSYDIGSDIALLFGYQTYANHSEYTQQQYADFSKQSNSDTFATSFTTYNSTDANNANGTTQSGTKATTPSSENICVSGNLVPVGISVPLYSSTFANKYYKTDWLESNETDILELINKITTNYKNSSRLVISVQYFANESQKYTTSLNFYSYKTTTSNHPYKSFSQMQEAFKSVGYYRVILLDMSNAQSPLSDDYQNDFADFISYVMSPNYSILNFRIEGVAPAVTVQEKVTAEETIYSTITKSDPINSDYVRVTFSDPADIYEARIDFKNITVTQTYSKYNVTLSTVNYNINSLAGVYNEETTYNVSVPTLYYSTLDENRNQYYLLLPKCATETNKVYSQYDCTYTVTVVYITQTGNTVSNEFVVNNTTTDALKYANYKSTKTISVDHTAPYKNLFKLIDNDTYLQSLGTTFINELKANIDNPDYDFLQNYAFSIPTGYIFSAYDPDETNTSGILYYKAYTNYTGALSAQTVVPGTDAYENDDNASRRFSLANTSQFSTLTCQSDYDLNTYSTINASGYYDIIEYDAAGNYRVYTVLVCNESANVSYNTDASNSYELQLAFDDYNLTQNGIDIANGATSFTYTLSSPTLTFTYFSNIGDDEDLKMIWLHITYKNMLTNTTTEYYLAPNGALEQFQAVTDKTNIEIFHSISALLAQLNSDVTTTYNTYSATVGCKLQFTIDNRLTSGEDFNLYLRTPGKKLIENTTDIQLTTSGNYFTITLPTYSLSTELTSIAVTLNGNPLTSDSTLTQTITNPPVAGTVYTFALSSSSSYTFTFVDNFGRTTTLIYPIDSTTQKELVFSGDTENRVVNGNTYTYTSTDTSFVYKSSVLNIINITITDMDTNEVVYANSNSVLENTATDYYTYTRDVLTNSVTTINFVSTANVHYLYNIEVGMTASNMYSFNYILYTIFPSVVLTDTSNVTLWSGDVEKITSKPVLISWQEIDNALFNPYVVLQNNGKVVTITSPTLVSTEGTYTVMLVNDLGTYDAGTITFTIRSYDVSVYGVYQVINDESTELVSREKSYSYNLNGSTILLTEYFFLGTWDTINVVCNEDKQLSATVIETINNTQIYHIQGTSTHKISIYIAITRIPTATTTTLVDDFSINGQIQRDYYNTLYPTTTTTTDLTAIVTWTDSYVDAEYISSPEIDNFYMVELWYNNVYVGTYADGSGTLVLSESGVYKLRLRDLVGQYQRFGTSYNYFTITIYNDVIFTVNDEAAIENATFNYSIDFAITDYSKYVSTSFVFTVKRNNLDYTATLNNGACTFTEPGVYSITLQGKLSNMGTNAKSLTNSYIFTILSPTEARTCYEFTSITGYQITSVLKKNSSEGNATEDYTDVTSTLLGTDSNLYSLYLSPTTTLGTGVYKITVLVSAKEFQPAQNYTFSVWINDSTPIITPSREWGSSSIDAFDLTFNPFTVYERVGDCYISVNGTKYYEINETTLSLLEDSNPVSINFTTEGTYIVQLYTISGNLISSNRLTINEPFNTAAIVLIIIFGVAIIGGIIAFIIMRTRMKIR